MALTVVKPLRRNQKKNDFLFRGGLVLQFESRNYKYTFGILNRKGDGNGNPISFEDVRYLCQQGRLKKALQLMCSINNPLQSSSLYACFLRACMKQKAFSEAKLLHTHMDKAEIVAEKVSWNTLINVYVKCGSLVDARRVFDEMPERDVCSWTVMIAAYSRHGCAYEALELFRQMKKSHIQPNAFALAGILPVYAKLASLQEGIQIHKEVIIHGFQSDIFVQSGLVDMYAKCGCIEKARKLFDKMSKRDVVSWNSMISGYAKNGYINEAHDLFQKMPHPDTVSWNTMIAGHTLIGGLDEALCLFQKMPKRDMVSWNAMISGFAQNGFAEEAHELFRKMPKPDVVSWTAMITGYAQSGNVSEAFKFFKEMPERDVASWTTMIGVYVQNGQSVEALKLFQQMQLAGMKPNAKTFASVLPAFAYLATLEQGMEIHAEIIRVGCQSVVFVVNALVDMYAKCGSIEKACYLFNKMQQRDVVSWNAMISGYGMHGCGREALELFEEMLQSGLRPDQVTLLGILSACCHAGLVDEGQKFFKNICQCYHITPEMEHYVCMVDLLGRAGRLHEAEDFISKMPIKPDVTVWESLLGACRLHHNIERGECVAKHLFELGSKSASPYVLLSNMYAESGRWDDTENVRRMMKYTRVRKKPGSSWIEVNKHVHVFGIGER